VRQLKQLLQRRHNREGYDVAFYLPYGTSIYAPQVGVPPGGAETQIHLIAQGLSRRGWRTAVIVSDAPGLPPSVKGVDIARRPAKTSSARWRLVGKLVELSKIARGLGSVRADVFVQRTSSVETGFVGLVAKLKRSSFVWSSASDADFEFHILDTRRRNKMAYELGVRLADAIVVQTDHQRELCESTFGRTPFVIKSLGEPARPKAEEPEAFLWISRLVDYKRPMLYLDLARAIPSAQFRMVGVPSHDDPDLARDIERAAASIENLELLPPRPRPELLRLIDSAVAIVNTAEHEGMANIFLEGWARGVPALAFSNDPDGVIGRHGLGHCAFASFDEFVASARGMWGERGDQAVLSRRCQDYINDNHAPDVVTAQWADVLDRARTGRSAPAR
jgi:glycosyltransferase involved in cell wall biosynthesis